MTNDIDDVIREHQAEAVALLDELLAAKLPVIFWDISYVVPRKLTGQVSSHNRGDDDVLSDVTKWAKFFGTEVERKRGRDFTTVSTIKTYGNITVRVWGHIESRA